MNSLFVFAFSWWVDSTWSILLVTHSLPASSPPFKHSSNTHVQLDILRGVLFELCFTLAAFQRILPGFRHNDLDTTNVRAVAPYGWSYESVRGTFEAPMTAGPDQDGGGQPLTYLRYMLDNQTFHVPNYGFHARVADFDFVFGPLPRMGNRKLERRRLLPCARQIPLDELTHSCQTMTVTVESRSNSRANVSSSTSANQDQPSATPVLLHVSHHASLPDGPYAAWWGPGANQAAVLHGRALPDSAMSSPAQVCQVQQGWCAVVALVPMAHSVQGGVIQLQLQLDEQCAMDQFAIGDVLHVTHHDGWLARIMAINEQMATVETPPGPWLPVQPLQGLVAVLVVRVAHASEDWFFQRAPMGITPVPNDKYDLYHLFSEVLNLRLPLLGPVAEFLNTSIGYRHRYNMPKQQVRHHRLTDSEHPEHPWEGCHQKGELSTDDPRLDGILTPKEMLQHSFFEPLRRTPTDRAQQILPTFQLNDAVTSKARLALPNIPNGRL